jgi:hypothetical protein
MLDLLFGQLCNKRISLAYNSSRHLGKVANKRVLKRLVSSFQCLSWNVSGTSRPPIFMASLLTNGDQPPCERHRRSAPDSVYRSHKAGRSLAVGIGVAHEIREDQHSDEL